MQNYFETIKCDDYEVFNLDYHHKRMANTVFLNFNLNEYIYPPNNKLLKCKVIYNEEGIYDVCFSEYKKKEIKTFKIIHDNAIIYDKKSINRDTINALYETRENADEIIIIKNNIVTDTSIANIAIFDGTSWLTSTKPLLKGTARAKFLENKEIIEADVSMDMLLNSEKIALFNAMIGMDVKSDYSFLL